MPTDHPEALALLVGATEAARLCGVSRASWDRYCAAGKAPAPVRLGGRVLWRAEELRAWTAAGCPERQAWVALQAANSQRNGRK